MKLFKLAMKNHVEFYIAAQNETNARELCEKQWSDWGYIPSTVIYIELIGEQKQYTDVSYFISQ